MSAGAKIGAVAVIRITGGREQGTGASGS
jgi:hypothetical protein